MTYVLPSSIMLFIVTPLGSRDRFRIFSITAKASFKERPICGGSRTATSLPPRVMAMRSPLSARLTISENLRRSSVIVNGSTTGEYHRIDRSAQSCPAKFGDHGFAALQDDGVNAIEDQEINHDRDGG